MQFIRDIRDLFNRTTQYFKTSYGNMTSKGFRWALDNRYFNVMKFFVYIGANPNQADKDGRTPLYWAAFGGHLYIVKALIEAGANPHQANIADRTPLYWAAYLGHLDIVKALIQYDANPNQADIARRTPLHEAAYWGHLDIVKALIEAGADVTQADIARRTPLHEAAYLGHLDIVKALIEAGADVTQDNLSKFIKRRWKDIIKLAFIHNEDLLSHCRDIKSYYGKEPIVQLAIAEIDREANEEYVKKAPRPIIARLLHKDHQGPKKPPFPKRALK